MINVLAIAAAVASMTSNWLLATGRLRRGFACAFVTSLICVALDILFATQGANQAAAALLIVPSLWSAGMSVMALRRLARESVAGHAQQTEESP